MKKFDRSQQWSASKKFKQESIFPEAANLQKPKISFEFLNGKYCISKCESKEKAQVIDTLYRISQSTWQELIQLGKNGSGYEQFSRKQLRCHIPDTAIFQNHDKVTIFHRKDKIPIVGFRIGETFYIFCVDRDYSAYGHG